MLTPEELFTPAPSGIGTTVPAAGSWLEKDLEAAAIVGLPTTAWQPGGVARTLLAIHAVGQAESDAMVSAFAQAGFLQWAATGTVTHTKVDGTTVTLPVTPDPSDPAANPTAKLGWLDALAQQVYNVDREPATFAAGLLYLVNGSASTVGPLASGQFHVASVGANHPTYANTTTLTLSPSTAFDVTAGSVSGSTVSLTLSSVAGLAAGSVLFVAVLSGKSLLGVDNTFYRLLSVNGGTKVVTFTQVGASGVLTGTVAGAAAIPVTTPVQADFSGPGSTVGPGEVTQLVTTYPGVFCTNLDSYVGGNWESNAQLAARCLLKLQSISPGGAAGAYAYVALTALALYDEAAIPLSGNVLGTVHLSQAITKVIVNSNTATGAAEVILANATGVPHGLVQSDVTAATNTSPIVVTSSLSCADLSTGDIVYITGVDGNTAANGYWQLGTVGAFTLELVGSVGNGAYTGGGAIEGGDLGLVDLLLQSRVVGQAVTETTQVANTVTVNIVATVIVPIAQASAYTPAADTALAAFFAGFPIGGYSGKLPISAIEGVLYAAGGAPSYVKRVDGLTLDGVAADVTMASTDDAVLGTITITVVGV